MRKIATVVLFANGMVVVFDAAGGQIPDYQGLYDEVKDKIRAVYDGPWSFGVWLRWLHEGIAFDDIEFTVKQLKACWKDEK